MNKNCSYCENKNAARVRKKNTLEMNKFKEDECLPNLELKFKILENLRKPLILKSTGKCIDIDFERVSFVCTLARLTK